MTDIVDIVVALNEAADQQPFSEPFYSGLCEEAAAEIEKLRAERDALLYQFNELMLEVWHQLGMREEYQETDDVKAHENRCRALLGDAALASGAKDE